MKKKNILILTSSLLLLSSFNLTNVYSKEINSLKMKKEGNLKEIPFLIDKKGNKYVHLENISSFLNFDIVKENQNQITLKKDDVEYILKVNEATFLKKEDNKESIYPLVIERINPVKRLFVPKNNLKLIKENDTLFIPLEAIENVFIFNQRIKDSEGNTYLLEENTINQQNYNYENAFDSLDINEIEENRTAKYSVLDEKYNQLPIGTEVKPSPVTGFSVIKPSYGFGSSTFDYIQSKGSAELDGWKAGTITSKFTKDKKKQMEIMQLELGLVNGEYIFIDELSIVLWMDYLSLEDGVIINATNLGIIKNFPETYRQQVILSSILSYYINDSSIVKNIMDNHLEYQLSDEKEVKEDILNEKINLKKTNSAISISILF